MAEEAEKPAEEQKNKDEEPKFSRPETIIYYCMLHKWPLYNAHERLCRDGCLGISEHRNLPFEEAIKKCENATPDHKEWHTEVCVPIHEKQKEIEEERLEDQEHRAREELIKIILDRPVYQAVPEEILEKEIIEVKPYSAPAGVDYDFSKSKYVEEVHGVKVYEQDGKKIYLGDFDNVTSYFQAAFSAGYLQTDFSGEIEFIIKFLADGKYQSKSFKILARKENKVVLEEITEAGESKKESTEN